MRLAGRKVGASTVNALNVQGAEAASQSCGSAAAHPALTAEHDVDNELWSLLDIASDEELVEVYDILFGALITLCMVMQRVACMHVGARHHGGAAAVSPTACACMHGNLRFLTWIHVRSQADAGPALFRRQPTEPADKVVGGRCGACRHRAGRAAPRSCTASESRFASSP